MSSKVLQNPQSIDACIGKRINLYRKAKGLTQKQLAQSLTHPITMQQIQKYEAGRNRINVIMLCDIAQILEVDLEILIKDLLTPSTASKQKNDWDRLIEIINIFEQIESTDIKVKVLQLIKGNKI